MVTEFGMSEKMGPIAYEEPDGEVFLGYSMTKRKNIADETALNVDKEIHRIIQEALDKARKILNEKREDLETLAEGLMEYETLSGAEIKDLLKGKKPDRSEHKVMMLKSSVPETDEDEAAAAAATETEAQAGAAQTPKKKLGKKSEGKNKEEK
jgi:cell division protease FtsH